MLETNLPLRKKVFYGLLYDLGCHLRGVKNAPHIEIGITQHHLRILEKSGKIILLDPGTDNFCFLSGIIGSNEKDVREVFSQNASRDALLIVLKNKDSPQTEIVNKVGVTRAAINWHIHS